MSVCPGSQSDGEFGRGLIGDCIEKPENPKAQEPERGCLSKCSEFGGLTVGWDKGSTALSYDCNRGDDENFDNSQRSPPRVLRNIHIFRHGIKASSDSSIP
jgi:hypothetical protein